MRVLRGGRAALPGPPRRLSEHCNLLPACRECNLRRSDRAFSLASRKVAYQTLDGTRLDAKALGEIAITEGILTPEQVQAIFASNKHAYTDLEKILRKHLYSMWARGEINIGPFHGYLGPDDTWAAAEPRASLPKAASNPESPPTQP